MLFQYRHFFFLLSCTLAFQACSKDSNEPTTPDIQVNIKTLGGSLNERGQSVIPTSDGGYAVLGYTQSNDGDVLGKTDTSFDYWFLKFDATNELQWQKTYGGSQDDRGQCIIQTSDGGFALLGSSKSSDGDVSANNGYDDLWLVKIDASGAILWEKSFGYSGTDIAYSLIQTNDEGYLLIGTLDVSASGGQGNNKMATAKSHAGGDYWLIKLNTSGDLQWSHYYGGTFTDTPFGAVETNDGNFIIVGSSDSNDVDITNNKGTYDFWVIKVSASGTLIWEKNFGGSNSDEAKAITASGDGNYIIVGNTRSNDIDVTNNHGAADVWVIKINPSGDLLWQKTFGGSSFDATMAIRKTPHNNFIIAGNSRSADGDLKVNFGQNDVWILKIDSDGNLLSQNTWGGSNIDLAFDAVTLDNNMVITVGESSSSDGDIKNNKGFSDLLIIENE